MSPGSPVLSVAKAVIAVVGITAVVLVALLAPDSLAAVLAPVLGVLTAVGVYQVPNTATT